MLDSRTYVRGTPRPWPDVEDNDWPSDHAAVVTTFALSGARRRLTAGIPWAGRDRPASIGAMTWRH
ncbi:hypothetical protein GCM10027075_12690 [Streptomyces heilongjiangensis]|nr:hypothetical protein [Streptomyces heilongjiangensis]MDC2948466.1 hypothetical protein [Streptomyces heilongjiangensis]